ncbi:MAG TPA: AAA family ATPase, partial [Kofleriaceae bacterium]|nr:AAA family ATPase [Kofleriaceae bacterium]
WEEDGRWFITMERVDGDDFLSHVATARPRAAATAPMAAVDPAQLDDRAAAAPRFDDDRLRRALAQLATGLVALHDAGVIHRDVKPSNVRVAPDGRVVVLDFGLARPVATAPDGEPAAGTPAYMAPEQAVPGAARREADWYALGAMLYEALTGHLPYTGAAGDVLFNKRRFAPPPPGALAPGVPPDLAALCLDLLAADPGARPSGDDVLARLAGRPVRRAVVPAAAPALIGRDRELAELAGALAERLAGAPGWVRITGESGIGKTALLDAFAARTAAAGRAWLVRGRCAQRELVPFRGFDGVVDDLAARLAGAGLAAPRDLDLGAQLGAHLASDLGADLGAVLVQAFPVLRRVPAFAALAVTAGQARRETASRVAAALRWLLAQVAAARPLVIAIDDLQWADLDTIALLRDVLEPALPGLLIVVVTRDRDEPALPGARQLALAPLSLEDTAGLVRRLIADPAIDGAAIAREAGGHPWFAIALARHATARPGLPGAPVTLEHALRHTARRFGPAADQLLAAVCLAHAPIDADTARRAIGEPAAAVFDALALLRAGQLVMSSGVGAGERLEPYHDRIRQAVLAALAPGARIALHLAIASALEATPAADAEALALHWSEAGYPAAAASHALRAAEQAAGALAFHRAARLYRWVVELAPAGAPDLSRIRVKHAEALAQAGLGVAAAEAFLACAASETGAAELRLRRLAMQQLLVMGHTDRALVLLDGLMRDLGLPNPTRPRRLLAALVVRRLVVRARRPRLGAGSADDVPARDRARIDLTWDATAGLAMV